MMKCVVSGCPSRHDSNKAGAFPNRPSKKFFNFPKDQTRVKVWLAALREGEKEDTEQLVICEDHFLKDHITSRGISDDAIPITPTLDGLDGGLGSTSPWGEESSDEGECADVADPDPEDDDCQIGEPANQPGTSSGSAQQGGKTAEEAEYCRKDQSLGLLTKRFLKILQLSPDGVVDINDVTLRLQARKRRIYDITNVLQGIHIVEKKSASKVQWIGFSQTRLPNSLKPKLQRELDNMKIVEERLDELIKSCAKQLFEMTDNTENSKSAYVTHEDVSRLKVFEGQTVIAIKAPEETKLEVPTPKEDNIQIHLKGGWGPIKVLTCEVDGPDDALGPGRGSTRAFITLAESRIKTMLLTDDLLPHTTVQTSA